VKISFNIIFFILIILLFSSCRDESDSIKDNNYKCEVNNPLSKKNRMIGVDLLDLTESNSFDDNIILAKEIGAEFISLHLTWSSIEVSPSEFTDPYNAIKILGKIADTNNLKFSLTIRPIDLTGKTVPSDLSNTRFNNPMMINRFKALVKYIFLKVDSEVLLNFQIGNEIDGYDTSSEAITFWNDYGIFLKEITKFIHNNYPTVKVGFTGMFSGLVENRNRFISLLKNVDILGVTYYPINSDFSVIEPNVIFEDFERLVNTYKDVPIYLQEVGYQSSTLSNSSMEKQAEFYCDLFEVWDLYSDNIKTINIVRLNDLSLKSAKESAEPYGISNSKFIEYLRSLGLRSFDDQGTNKQAYDVIKRNIKIRGW